MKLRWGSTLVDRYFKSKNMDNQEMKTLKTLVKRDNITLSLMGGATNEAIFP
jgi:hypothetical protein